MLIDNKIPLIYISGWKGSGKGSSSYKWLERYFKNTECYAAGGQTDVEKMVNDLSEMIVECRHKYGVDPILVGNSYGGFLASLFPQTLVLINPALFPSESLPHIADISAEEIDRFRDWQGRREAPRNDVYAVCTEGDELIPDHRTEVVSTNAPVMIPGGTHRLTDEQRDQFLLPILHKLVQPTYRIVKLCCDDLEKLKAGECCRNCGRRFPSAIPSFREAEKHLKWYIKHRPGASDNGKTVIGYLIQEIYGNDPRRVYRQWSYAPDGQPLAEAAINCMSEFFGRDPQTLPFHRGDYVIAYYCGDLILGWISSNSPSPTEVEDAKELAEKGVLCDWGPFYYRLDSSDDCYLVDFTERLHGHPSVAEVFPLPFPESAISPEVKEELQWY